MSETETPGAMLAPIIPCVGGCQKQLMGPARPLAEPEDPKVREAMHEAAKRLGWVQQESGFWKCGETCSGFPFDLSKFKLRDGLASRYTIKTINPAFYGKVTVENLDANSPCPRCGKPVTIRRCKAPYSRWMGGWEVCCDPCQVTYTGANNEEQAALKARELEKHHGN